jgi:hypothetical protein
MVVPVQIPLRLCYLTGTEKLTAPSTGSDMLCVLQIRDFRIRVTLTPKIKGKGHAHNRPQGPKRVRGRLRPRIFLTFGTTRVVDRQPHAPAAFTPRGIPWYSFLDAESTPGHMVPSVATEKIPSVTPPGIDPETVRLVAQCSRLRWG